MEKFRALREREVSESETMWMNENESENESLWRTLTEVSLEPLQNYHCFVQ